MRSLLGPLSPYEHNGKTFWGKTNKQQSGADGRVMAVKQARVIGVKNLEIITDRQSVR